MANATVKPPPLLPLGPVAAVEEPRRKALPAIEVADAARLPCADLGRGSAAMWWSSSASRLSTGSSEPSLGEDGGDTSGTGMLGAASTEATTVGCVSAGGTTTVAAALLAPPLAVTGAEKSAAATASAAADGCALCSTAAAGATAAPESAVSASKSLP
jgi:hypothetical protein